MQTGSRTQAAFCYTGCIQQKRLAGATDIFIPHIPLFLSSAVNIRRAFKLFFLLLTPVPLLAMILIGLDFFFKFYQHHFKLKAKLEITVLVKKVRGLKRAF